MADVIVGRFTLIDLVAKGGSGSVWRAWDAKTDAVCAAKVLRQRDSADLMRFVREKGVSFDHPHLLTPYGWGAEDEHVVIAMPLVSGPTLEGLVRRTGSLAEPAVVVILDQLLDGLGHVHSQGWIHRDVKPANIMFQPTGRARPQSRLADFGIAVHESDVRFTHVGMVNGTPGYMAPELFSMAEPAPSHDLYAAGVVAMFALNGPLNLRDGAFRADELDHHLRSVTPKLAAVIRKLVAPQPGDRYQDAASVRADLPRVPPDYPLSFADGRPLEILDQLPPLANSAPVTPQRAQPGHGDMSMEAIRQGNLKQASPGQRTQAQIPSPYPSPSSASPGYSPQTGPRQYTPGQSEAGGQGGAYGSPSVSSPPYGTQSAQPQQNGAGDAGGGPALQGSAQSGGSRLRRARTDPRGMVVMASVFGLLAAVVLGVIVTIVLINLFPADSQGGDGASDGGSSSAVVAMVEDPVPDL